MIQTITLRGRVKKDLGNKLIIEFAGGRFHTLNSNIVKVEKHRNPKKRDYITVPAALAEERGLELRVAPVIQDDKVVAIA